MSELAPRSDRVPTEPIMTPTALAYLSKPDPRCASSIFASVLLSRRYNIKPTLKERGYFEHRSLIPSHSERPWDYFESDINTYIRAWSIFPTVEAARGYIRGFAIGEDALACDIGASAAVVEELVSDFGYRGGVAVSLGSDSNTPLSNGIRQIGGDILSKKTWKGIHTYLDTMQSPGFRFVASHMAGGTMPEHITDSDKIHLWLLNQVWQTMHPDGSTALVQGRQIIQPPPQGSQILDAIVSRRKRLDHIHRVDEFIHKLDMHGVICVRDKFGGSLALVRKPGDPESLFDIL